MSFFQFPSSKPTHKALVGLRRQYQHLWLGSKHFATHPCLHLSLLTTNENPKTMVHNIGPEDSSESGKMLRVPGKILSGPWKIYGLETRCFRIQFVVFSID